MSAKNSLNIPINITNIRGINVANGLFVEIDGIYWSIALNK
jgi:hypothetical protein